MYEYGRVEVQRHGDEVVLRFPSGRMVYLSEDEAKYMRNRLNAELSKIAKARK